MKIVVPAFASTAAYAERCCARGVQVERTPLLTGAATTRGPRLLRRLSGAREFLNIVRFVHRYNAPVLHFQLGGADTLSHYFLRALRLLRRPPVFVTPTTNTADLLPDEATARLWAAVAPRRLRKVICVSERGRSRQLSYGVPAEQVELIYNGIDVARFGAGDPSRARSQVAVGAHTPLILTHSRLDQGKRPLDALEAFRKIAAEFPEAHLVFVGEGPLEARIRDMADRAGLAPRVHLTGYQTNIPDWLAAATVWFLPTESEGFSMAVLEAMAARCPIVSTLCPGNDEVLMDGENALLTAVGDVDAQAAALRRLLSDAELRASLGAAAHRAAQRYSIDRMAEAHMACYAGA